MEQTSAWRGRGGVGHRGSALASKATLLETSRMLTTISMLNASAPVGTRDAENTIHFSTGVISSFGPEVKDYDSTRPPNCIT